MRILLVEDDFGIREALTALLHARDHEVTVARDGQDGLESFKKQDFDLVLSDFQMPRMNGISMVLEIRKIKPTQFIIIQSSDRLRKDLDKLGLMDVYFLEKPWRYQQLSELIQHSPDKNE